MSVSLYSHSYTTFGLNSSVFTFNMSKYLILLALISKLTGF